jgi:hypothetical protein
MRKMFGESEDLHEAITEDARVRSHFRNEGESGFEAGRGCESGQCRIRRLPGAGLVEHHGGGRGPGASRQLAF